jgi:hypothetical protein
LFFFFLVVPCIVCPTPIPVPLDCPFMMAPSVFSNVFFTYREYSCSNTSTFIG